MISLTRGSSRLCDGVTRRDFLRIGSLGTMGLGLPGLLRAESLLEADRPPRSKAKSCILFYLQGGQSQLETFDMKPRAPEQVRGVFKPIATNVPGTQICEHLPRLARMADKYALIRSMTHKFATHNPAGYYSLCGQPPDRDQFDLRRSPDDHPNPGAMTAKHKRGLDLIPPFVQLSGPLVGDIGIPMPGQTGGFLGASYDPFCVTLDPNEPNFGIDELSLPVDVTPQRLEGRQRLLDVVQEQFPKIRDAQEMDRLNEHYKRAFQLVTSVEARQAFDIGREPASVRDRYGRHTQGQSLLLARRLIESGVRFVTVYWGGALNVPDSYWDTHTDSIPKQRDRLLPRFDQCLSALLEDLDDRGLLDSTLVASLGEFGRTPKMGQTTGENGTDQTGRDHWPHCYSVLLAGGGVTGGAVIGESDRFAAQPAERPTAPEDLVATIYDALGLDWSVEVNDRLGRPLPITRGQPINELFES
ncbi:DUF1501 domain-containing protein [Singulisphaera sp. PoT]|uniref:DUF1501 domain-containing protein n=1 Tax=Singulisphaera sp. PoT TaxID=3411797 RepID=UPI003BF58D0F